MKSHPLFQVSIGCLLLFPALLFAQALEKVVEYGFDAEELKALSNLSFVGRNLDTGGELRGRIKV